MFHPFFLVIWDSLRRWLAWWVDSLRGQGSPAGRAAAILIGLFVLACAYTAFAEGLRNAGQAIATAPTATPTVMPTPSRIPRPTEFDPTSTPTPAVTPQPTRTPRPTSTPTEAPPLGLGIERAAIQERYEQEGFIFQDAPALRGQPRVIGADPRTSASIELIGPADDITQVKALVSLSGTAAQVQDSADLLNSLLTTVLPDWTDGPAWLQDQLNLTSFISGDGGTYEATEGEHRVTFQLMLEGDSRIVALTITGTGR
jgi:hypothetical protein